MIGKYSMVSGLQFYSLEYCKVYFYKNLELHFTRIDLRFYLGLQKVIAVFRVSVSKWFYQLVTSYFNGSICRV